MQKMTKGAIAAAAAALLLVGGGGTFMSWNQDAPITGDTIIAGSLTLAAEASPTWTLNDVDVTDEIDGVQIVPGDVVKFSHVATINAVGDNIQGELSLVEGTISPVSTENGVDQQLADALKKEGSGTSFAIETEEVGLTPVEGSPGVYEFTEAGEYDAALTATFDFGIASVTDLLAQGALLASRI